MTKRFRKIRKKKIKRCQSSVPDDVKVIIGTNEKLVLDKDVNNQFNPQYYQYLRRDKIWPEIINV